MAAAAGQVKCSCGQSGTEAGIIRVFLVSLPIIIHQILHNSHLSSVLLQWAIYGLRTKGRSLNAP